MCDAHATEQPRVFDLYGKPGTSSLAPLAHASAVHMHQRRAKADDHDSPVRSCQTYNTVITPPPDVCSQQTVAPAAKQYLLYIACICSNIVEACLCRCAPSGTSSNRCPAARFYCSSDDTQVARSGSTQMMQGTIAARLPRCHHAQLVSDTQCILYVSPTSLGAGAPHVTDRPPKDRPPLQSRCRSGWRLRKRCYADHSSSVKLKHRLIGEHGQQMHL